MGQDAAYPLEFTRLIFPAKPHLDLCVSRAGEGRAGEGRAGQGRAGEDDSSAI